MSSDFAAALWVPADPSNFRTAQRAPMDIKNIVIHETDGHPEAQGTADMFATPVLKRLPPIASSAHFIVGNDGAIIQSVRIKDIAYHAHSANASSIGIEHCARAAGEWGPSDPGLPASTAQLAASAILTAYLCRACGLPPDRVTIQGHCEIDKATTHTHCPIACIDLDAYVAQVAVEYGRLIPCG